MLDRGHSRCKVPGHSGLGRLRDCKEARVWLEQKEHIKASDKRREGTGEAVTWGFAGHRVDSAHPD